MAYRNLQHFIEILENARRIVTDKKKQKLMKLATVYLVNQYKKYVEYLRFHPTTFCTSMQNQEAQYPRIC